MYVYVGKNKCLDLLHVYMVFKFVQFSKEVASMKEYKELLSEYKNDKHSNEVLSLW